MTYSSIAYSMLTHLRQQKTVDIKLPVPIIDAKTMLSFSALCKIHFFVKLFHQWLALSTDEA